MSMRICFIIDKLTTGGAQRQLILIANAFAAIDGNQVQLVCLQGEGELRNEVSGAIRVRSLRLRRVYGFKALCAMLLLGRQLRSERTDIVQTFLPSANIFGTLLGRVHGLKVIVSRRDVGIYPGKIWQLLEERVAFRWANKIVCVSQEVRSLLIGKYSNLQGKAIVIPNAIDQESAGDFPDASLVGEGDEDPYVVTVGRVEAVKGYDFLVDAMKSIAIRVKVVGGGSLLGQMKSRADELGVAGRIEFVGERRPSEIAGILKQAAFAIHPSYSEGMSNAILEYMLHGNAVVCRDIPSNRELVRDGENGFLFRDSADFREKVMILAENAEMRSRMSDAARKYVLNNHSRNGILTLYNSNYKQLLLDQ